MPTTFHLGLAIVLLVLFLSRLWDGCIGPGSVYPNLRQPLPSSSVPLGLACLAAFLNLWSRTAPYAAVPIGLLILFLAAPVPQRIWKRWQQRHG